MPTLSPPPSIPLKFTAPEAQKLAADLTEVILPLGVALSKETDCDRLLELVLKAARKLCYADAGCFYLRRDNTLELVALYNNTLNIEKKGNSIKRDRPTEPVSLEDAATHASSLVVRAAQSGETLHIADARQLQDAEVSVIRAFDAKYDYETISCLTVPLNDTDGSAIAVLQLFNSKTPSGDIIPFSDYQQHVIQWLAAQSTAALNNQQLLQQQVNFLKGERDLQIGRQIQLDFLPETLPKIPGWEIAATFHPARDVAGDFYDAFPMPNGRIGLVIADVCDKGVGAALFMSLFRTLVRILARQNYSLSLIDQLTGETPQRPANARKTGSRIHLPRTGTQGLQNAITLTNNYIAETHFRTSMFATMFFGVLNPANGQMIYINAGHEAPLICGSDGTIKAHLGSTGPAVGMMPNMEFKIEQVQLCPGDSLFTYTDGVPEAHAPSGEMFSDERILELLAHPTDSITDTIDRIEKAVRHHISTAPQFDDITMLAVRRL
ncbi:GAF domain-containing SpoIIE family protein phosphatase [Leptolyngbya sp. Heron Island J]|uniref:GAF domain-containing SpoIIE family protein phosphatase n=1 Tax=Leptolyngbya sp. Heron Island J TaxID=1385935 RepID=UPI0013770E51|nr:PP2C family protein-serine/threonine phosphatase [Leptolyngbya sp. Heron Island J]